MTRLISGSLGVALVVVGILLGAYLRSIGERATGGALAGGTSAATTAATPR